MSSSSAASTLAGELEEQESAEEAAALGRARQWLRQVYRGRVELGADYPIAESDEAFVFTCRAVVPPGAPPAAPLLNVSLAVPKDGAPPFHLANDDPWGDLAELAEDPSPRPPQERIGRTNARGALLAADALVAGSRIASAPWRPRDEEIDWWPRWIGRWFPGAELHECADWDEVGRLVEAGGEGSRGVVWVRREANGHEATGHLLYALFDRGRVVYLDGMRGGPADIEGEEDALALHLARFHRARPASAVLPWRQPAADLAGAVAKAQSWLDDTYGPGTVQLVAPAPEDDYGRGWFFGCNSTAYLAGGDWAEAMLDAAVVVPKDGEPPFCLPQDHPWQWLERWLAGGVPGADGLEPLPVPASPHPGWLARSLASVGEGATLADVKESGSFAGWAEAKAALDGYPYGSAAVVWVRRVDARGREVTGRVLRALRTPAGTVLSDPWSAEPPAQEPAGVAGLGVVRYR
ncbi:YrhB domain-containing protein [Phaeacidiphilus oryzae]|uniref:YrhB domain-containing protein n=1 Tax=Phaeacidiphilus oryzae TaxID=348818 RepID=UPI000A033155|nr:YrhB domain-containing protein [Phaeacidiphilus oryzae]